MTDIFSVEINKSFDVLKQEWTSNVFLKLYVTIFTTGLWAELGNDRAAVLLAIAAHMDEDGHCYPTQERISKLTGMSRQTVNKWVNSLLEFKWNGKPVIVREKIRNQKGNEYSDYRVLPLSQLAIFDGDIEALEAVSNNLTKPSNVTEIDTGYVTEIDTGMFTEFDINNNQAINKNQSKQESITPKDLVGYFVTKYREVYSASPSVNWGRDQKLIKNNLLTNYAPEQVMAIFDVVFDEYDRRWSSREYPRPTIGSIASFLHVKASVLLSERGKQEERQNDQGLPNEVVEALLKRYSGGAK